MTYLKPQNNLWQGRTDSLPDERFFQVMKCVDLEKQIPKKTANMAFAFVGFSCDTGIRRNMGRVGAKEGPLAIRRALGNLAVYPFKDFEFIDAGDVACIGDLESAQKELANIVKQLLDNNFFPIVLGGGHEVAFGHYLGLEEHEPEIDLGIINIDAHFDLRPLLEGAKGSSGTPFLQIADARKNKDLDFNYLCLGIQRLANTRSLFAAAETLGVETIFRDEINDINATKKLDAFIKKHKKIYLTICLDAFAEAYAPGVSAPQPLGLTPIEVLPLIQQIIASKKAISFDIAELSPPNDHNNMTARLAAGLIHSTLTFFID